MIRFIATAMLVLCAETAPATEPNYTSLPSYDCALSVNPAVDPAKENILIIGDSISLQYTPGIRALMTSYNVLHSPCNAAFSGYTRLHIADWLDDQPEWAAVIFNIGIWDLNTSDVPTFSYAQNVDYIAQQVKGRTPVPIFVTTTEHPNFPDKKRDMRLLALDIMLDRDIHVYDLEVESEAMEDMKAPDLVHYTPEGSFDIAVQIATFLAIKLGY